MAMTFIPQWAEQEFYDELDERLASQPDEWQSLANDQKVFLLPSADVDYLIKLKQQHQSALPIDTDLDDLPSLFFRGIRVKAS